MDSVFSSSEERGVEHGFQVDVNGDVGDIGTGDELTIDSIPSVYSKTGCYVDYDVHTHGPLAPVEGMILWNSEPSTVDKSNHIGNSPNVVLGYKDVTMNNPKGTKTISFYNEGEQVGRVLNYEYFKRIVRKISKHKND